MAIYQSEPGIVGTAYDKEHGDYEIISISLEVQTFGKVVPRDIVVECSAKDVSGA